LVGPGYGVAAKKITLRRTLGKMASRDILCPTESILQANVLMIIVSRNQADRKSKKANGFIRHSSLAD
jgi:hypothetical protein